MEGSRFKCRLGDSFRRGPPDSRFVASYSFMDRRVVETRDKDRAADVQMLQLTRLVAGQEQCFRGKLPKESQQIHCVFVWDPIRREFVIERAPLVPCSAVDRNQFILPDAASASASAPSSSSSNSKASQQKIRLLSPSEPSPKRQRGRTAAAGRVAVSSPRKRNDLKNDGMTQRTLSATFPASSPASLPQLPPPPPPSHVSTVAVRLPTALGDLVAVQSVEAAYAEGSSSESEDDTDSGSD